MEHWNKTIRAVRGPVTLIALLILAVGSALALTLVDLPESQQIFVAVPAILIFLILGWRITSKQNFNKDKENSFDENSKIKSEELNVENEKIKRIYKESIEDSRVNENTVVCQINPILDAIDHEYDVSSEGTIIKTLDLDILRWKLDSNTRNQYFDSKNINALKRGVIIHRIFAVDEKLLASDKLYKLKIIPDIIREHVVAGIKVKLLTYSSLVNNDAKEDYILMKDFLAIEYFHDAGSSRNYGKVSVDNNLYQSYNKRFDSLWNSAVEIPISGMHIEIVRALNRLNK